MSPRRLILVLFLAALLVRCGFLLAWGLSAPVTQWGDDPEYDATARTLALHHLYQNSWFPPGYPLVLSALYAIFGPSLVAVRLLQALLGAATCCLVYLIGRDVAGATAGRLAGFLLAFYPGHVYLTWRLMAETLWIFLVALAVLLACRLERGLSEGAERRASLARAAALGLAAGASVLVKSNLILLPPLLFLWLAGVTLARARRGRRAPAMPVEVATASGAPIGAPAARGLEPFLVLVVLAASFCAAGLIAPLAYHVSTRGSTSGPARFWLLPGNSGHTFWWSNNPLADGYFVDPEAAPAGRSFIARHGMSALIHDPDPFVRDRACRALGFAWVRENPGSFLALTGRKLWNGFGPLPKAALFAHSKLAHDIHLISYGALLPLAAAGLILSIRRWRQWTILYLVLLAHAAMTAATYGTPRFTLVIIPYLLVFAGQALAAAMALRERRAPRVSPALSPAPRFEDRASRSDRSSASHSHLPEPEGI